MVDDDVRLVATWRRQLESLGHEVLAAYAVEAAAAYLKRETRLHGAIIDRFLPDGGGEELLIWLRARLPNLPILVTTGAALDEPLLNALLGVGAQFRRKPLLRATLESFADRALAAANSECGGVWASFIASAQLTHAESTTPRALLECDSESEAAALLGLAQDTVRTHRKRVLRKTGCTSIKRVACRLLRKARLFDNPSAAKRR